MILGITGGVGSGKSTVLNYLKEKYDAVIIIADHIGKYVIEKGYAGYDMVNESFPGLPLEEDGNFNRVKLAEIVFNDADKLGVLNSIIHPLVKAEIIRIINDTKDKTPDRLIVVEAALLIEDGYDLICDEIWYVFCDMDIRLKRLAKSRGYSTDKSLDIMRNQLTDEEFRKNTQACINNSGKSEDTFRQIDELLVKRSVDKRPQK